MTEIKLKPCPFCGEKETAEIFDQNELDGIREGEFGYSDDPNFAACCAIRNGGCGACGGFRAMPEQAAEAWNRRADNARYII